VISRDRPCLLLGSYEEEPARRNRNSKLPQGTGGSRRGLHDAPIARNLIGRRFPQVRAPNLGVYARALGIRGGLGDRDLLVFVISDSERGTESTNRVLQDLTLPPAIEALPICGLCSCRARAGRLSAAKGIAGFTLGCPAPPRHSRACAFVFPWEASAAVP
jgi:hypothetical protein